MKIQIYLLIGIISFLFVSCKLDGKNEASPQLYLSNTGGIIKNNTDTLTLSVNPERTAYLLDTIQAGDSVQFKLLISGGFNGIRSLNLSLSDSTLAQLSYQAKDSLDRIFTEKSNYNKGLFIMDGTYNQLNFPFYLYAKKESKDLLLKIYVSTTASERFNEQEVSIKIPIKAKTEFIPQ